MQSWKWEIKDGSKWISNAIRFATLEEAEGYGRDLYMRWTSYALGRGSPSEDPVSHLWREGALEESPNVKDTSTS